MNRTYPQSLTLITNIPHCSPKFQMPFIVWVPSMLTVSGRDSISASPLCGFLRSSEHVGCSTPARQTIAVVSKDSAGLWSGSGCNLNTSGSVVSAHSLCEERQLWDELLRTFKYLVDQPFHIWQAEMNTRQVLKGRLKGIDALVFIDCGWICKIFIVNWRRVKYPKRGLGNIQVRETRHGQCSESYSIFGFVREKHFTHTQRQNFTLQSEYSPFSLRRELAAKCDEQWVFWVRTTQWPTEVSMCRSVLLSL